MRIKPGVSVVFEGSTLEFVFDVAQIVIFTFAVKWSISLPYQHSTCE